MEDKGTEPSGFSDRFGILMVLRLSPKQKLAAQLSTAALMFIHQGLHVALDSNLETQTGVSMFQGTHALRYILCHSSLEKFMQIQ